MPRRSPPPALPECAGQSGLARMLWRSEPADMVRRLEEMLWEGDAVAEDIERGRETLFVRLLDGLGHNFSATVTGAFEKAWQLLSKEQPQPSQEQLDEWLVRKMAVAWDPVTDHLLSQGANPNTAIGNGMTCLQEHLARGGLIDDEPIDCLWHKAGADWQGRTQDGRSLMHLVVDSGQLSILVMVTATGLLRRGVKLDAREQHASGQSLLDVLDQQLQKIPQVALIMPGQEDLMRHLAQAIHAARETQVLRDALADSGSVRSKPRV